MTTPLQAALVERIRRSGPLHHADVVDAALYDEIHGFYAAGGGAGRRGDFLTSVEVGPLFGAVLARYLDARWVDLGRPDPFVVVEAAAGAGTLARALVHASPACAAAWRLVLVERSAALRGGHPVGARIESRSSMPDGGVIGVVLANELLDNVAFDVWEHRRGAWHEVRVDEVDGTLVERIVAAEPGRDDDWIAHLAAQVPAPPDGARVARQAAASGWLADALGALELGDVLLFDYTTTTAAMARRPFGDWVRTYRAHARGGAPLQDLGTQDVTVEVAVDQLALVQPPTWQATQADFLRAHGIDALVEEGRAQWQARAGIGDLAALRARSRIREADALTDLDGLGGFTAMCWQVGADR